MGTRGGGLGGGSHLRRGCARGGRGRLRRTEPPVTSGSRPLTIGIDARAAVEVPAGRGRGVRGLLRALAAQAEDPHRYVLYARRAWDGVELDERFAWHTIAAGDPWWHLLAAQAANRVCDVFLSCNS